MTQSEINYLEKLNFHGYELHFKGLQICILLDDYEICNFNIESNNGINLQTYLKNKVLELLDILTDDYDLESLEELLEIL